MNCTTFFPVTHNLVDLYDYPGLDIIQLEPDSCMTVSEASPLTTSSPDYHRLCSASSMQQQQTMGNKNAFKSLEADSERVPLFPTWPTSHNDMLSRCEYPSYGVVSPACGTSHEDSHTFSCYVPSLVEPYELVSSPIVPSMSKGTINRYLL
ncbi:hypothetical protein KVT40_002442 [Elsinoe batatas]|uniref:Uncharacterized protein n=1 Tax=Elsinoe batatas TaxID=2601811 RepID=A0A8K0PKP3_9PEZI|nr:hypothetical protein KVT40_002442 [Elsinoe batatas]